jgi:hypothetical protein
MPENQQRAEQELRIEAEKQIAEGIYSNWAMIAHTREEFFMDFIFVQPHQRDAAKVGTLRARIIASPEHMKRIHSAIGDNIRKYEEKFGTISATPQPTTTGDTTRVQ